MPTIHWSAPVAVRQSTERPEQRGESLVMSVEEAARLLGISRGLAYELARRGELPCLRLGRRMVVPRVALSAMVAGSSIATTTTTTAAQPGTAGSSVTLVQPGTGRRSPRQHAMRRSS